MGHGHSHAAEIKNPGTLQASGMIKGLFILFIIIGLATFGAALQVDAKRAWAAFLLNHFYFLALAVGGVFFAAIQWLTNAMWSAPVRRLSESFACYLPVALVMMVVLYFGIHHLYLWSHPEHVKGDLVLEGKAGYLSIPFFMVRNVGAVLIWIFLSWRMIKNSTDQDQNGSFEYTLKNRALAPAFIVLFALTFTFMSFDLLMSLDPHWFSTMFGVYCFAGLLNSTFATVAILTIALRRNGQMSEVTNENHLHDIGKFMFAFTVFYAYIGFSQFMLIWYANLPEETGYFIHRFHGAWGPASIALVIGKFVAPFFILLPRGNKRNEKLLWFMGFFMLAAQWWDLMWLVQPEFFAHPTIGWIEIGVTLGFLGLFGNRVVHFLTKHNVVAIKDPRLAESVHHHHQ